MSSQNACADCDIAWGEVEFPRSAVDTLEWMSQIEPAVSDEIVAVDAEDCAWLDERLVEYRELLVYLHDH